MKHKHSSKCKTSFPSLDNQEPPELEVNSQKSSDASGAVPAGDGTKPAPEEAAETPVREASVAERHGQAEGSRVDSVE